MPKFSGQPNGALCPCCGALYEGKPHGGVAQCTCCGVRFCVPKTDSLSANDLLDRGRELLKRGEFKEAEELFGREIAEDANEPEGHFLSALAAAHIRIVPDNAHIEGGYHLALHGGGKKLSESEAFARALSLATEEQRAIYSAYAGEAEAGEKAFRRLRKQSVPDTVVLSERGDERALNLVQRLRAAGHTVVTDADEDALLRAGLATSPTLIVFFGPNREPHVYGDILRYLPFSPEGRCCESIAAVSLSEERGEGRPFPQDAAPPSCGDQIFPIDASSDCVGEAAAYVREGLEKKRRNAEAKERLEREKERRLKQFQRKESVKRGWRSFVGAIGAFFVATGRGLGSFFVATGRGIGSFFVAAAKAVPAFFVNCFHLLRERERGMYVILGVLAAVQLLLSVFLVVYAAISVGMPLPTLPAVIAMGFLYGFAALFAVCFLLSYGLPGLLGADIGVVVGGVFEIICAFIAEATGGYDLMLWIVVVLGVPVSILSAYIAQCIAFRKGGSPSLLLGFILTMVVYAVNVSAMVKTRIEALSPEPPEEQTATLSEDIEKISLPDMAISFDFIHGDMV